MVEQTASSQVDTWFGQSTHIRTAEVVGRAISQIHSLSAQDQTLFLLAEKDKKTACFAFYSSTHEQKQQF